MSVFDISPFCTITGTSYKTYSNILGPNNTDYYNVGILFQDNSITTIGNTVTCTITFNKSYTGSLLIIGGGGGGCYTGVASGTGGGGGGYNDNSYTYSSGETYTITITGNGNGKGASNSTGATGNDYDFSGNTTKIVCNGGTGGSTTAGGTGGASPDGTAGGDGSYGLTSGSPGIYINPTNIAGNFGFGGTDDSYDNYYDGYIGCVFIYFNITTGFQVNGTDIISKFKLLPGTGQSASSSQAATSGYQINGIDLNEFFSPGTTTGNTNFNVNGSDLITYFAST